jgi:hypothetical protein
MKSCTSLKNLELVEHIGLGFVFYERDYKSTVAINKTACNRFAVVQSADDIAASVAFLYDTIDEVIHDYIVNYEYNINYNDGLHDALINQAYDLRRKQA